MKYFALVCLILSSCLWRNGRAQTQGTKEQFGLTNFVLILSYFFEKSNFAL